MAVASMTRPGVGEIFRERPEGVRTVEAMRGLLWTALILLVAGGLYLLRSPEAADQEIDGTPLPGAPEAHGGEAGTGRALAATSTVTIRVQAPDGSVPQGAEVGYEALHRERWVAAGSDGVRTFTDVPVGNIYALARAPGRVSQRQRRVVAAGTTEGILLVLHAKD